MMRRAVLLLAALLLGATMVSSAASAQTVENDVGYRALCGPLTLSSTTLKPGDSVTVSGTAATGGAIINIVLDNSTLLGTATSDLTSRFFSTSVTIPTKPAPSEGPHRIQAVQVTDPDVGCPSQFANVNIVGLTIELDGPTQATEPAAEEPLARTGSNSTLPLARLGFGLLAAGGLAMVVSRRRRASVSANA